jgi:hypothetical protein
VATFLYDFNMLYEILRVAIDPRPRKFTHYLTFRNRQRVPESERIRTVFLRVESPPELVAVLPSLNLPLTITAVGLFLKYLPQGIDGLGKAFELWDRWRNRELSRRLLAAQVKEAEQRVLPTLDARATAGEEETPKLTYPLDLEEGEFLLRKREVIEVVKQVSHRLLSDKVQIAQLELDLVVEPKDEESNRG